MQVKMTILFLAVMLLLAGCTSAHTISTPESKQLAKELKKDYEQLKKVEFQVFTSDIEWVLTWKERPSEEDAMGAFEKIQQYVQTEAFLEDVVHDIYIADFSRASEYPDVTIIYDLDNDKQFDQKYSSTLENESLGYAEWYYYADWTTPTSH